MNNAFLTGNLASDPEPRTTPTGKTLCTFSLAVNKGFGQYKKTDFFKVTAWGALGETCVKYLSKGKRVAICGSVGLETYEGKDGKFHATLTITAQEIDLPPRDSLQTAESGAQSAQGYQQGYQRGDMMRVQSQSQPLSQPEYAGEVTDTANTSGFTTYEGEFPF